MIIDKDVLDVLESSAQYDNVVELPNRQLDRKLYVKVNEILVSMGGKWNKKQKAHIFDSDITNRWNKMLDSGEWRDVKRDDNYFPTPLELADELLSWVEWSRVKSILEPSAGKGNLLKAIKTYRDEKSIDKYDIIAVEINEDYVEDIQDVVNHAVVINNDFLEHDFKDKKFDLILMNPPFQKNQDIKHITKALSLLTDQGQLCAICSSGAMDERTSLKARKQFQEMLSEYDAEIQKIDSGRFKESGTMVSSRMIYINKANLQSKSA